MQLTYLHIRNFKSICDMEIRSIDKALILVGKNNTGKTSVLDAAFGVEAGDLEMFHRMGIVSQYRRFGVWRRVFGERLPSFRDGELHFTLHVNPDGRVRYEEIRYTLKCDTDQLFSGEAAVHNRQRGSVRPVE